MTQELFNNILAVIGAFTGLSGLFISLYLLHKEKLKLIVNHPSAEKSSSYMGFNAIYDGQDDYGNPKYVYTPYSLLIWLQINNKSKAQTTIIEMSLKIPGCVESILNSRTSNDYNIANKYVIDKNGKVNIKSSWHFENTLNLPVSISSFSTTEGYFYFRDINIDEVESFAAILKIKIPQGISKHKILIKPDYPQLI